MFILLTSISAVTLLILYIWYVKLVSKYNAAKGALATIDAQLNMRLELIPNILSIANEFMKYERSLLNQITELRVLSTKAYNQSDSQEIKNHFAVSNKLDAELQALKIAVENYPELKADQTMVTAMQTYNEVEAQITAARRFYNASVEQLNNAVQIFPGSFIAKCINIPAFPFYSADENAKKSIDAKTFFTDNQSTS